MRAWPLRLVLYGMLALFFLSPIQAKTGPAPGRHGPR